MATRLELIAAAVSKLTEELKEDNDRAEAKERARELLAFKYSNERIIDLDASEYYSE